MQTPVVDIFHILQVTSEVEATKKNNLTNTAKLKNVLID